MREIYQNVCPDVPGNVIFLSIFCAGKYKNPRDYQEPRDKPSGIIPPEAMK